MSKPVEVMVIAEGASEQSFVEVLLAPYLAVKGVYLRATQITKKGQKGGDVKFVRAERDIINFLKQRDDTFVATFIDYYGVKEWPGLEDVRALHEPSPDEIAKGLNDAAVAKIEADLPNGQARRRYIPFTAVHEFEALLFSDAKILSEELGIDIALIDKVLEECGAPERINNHPETSPSNRLLTWTDGHYNKIARGIVIACMIGIEKMRSQCPNFNSWLCRLESLVIE